MSAYDVVAPAFNTHRALPAGVPAAIRAAVLKSLADSPRLLDLGAGSGRIGSAFVAAGDDYVGLDLSSAMLREFVRHAVGEGAPLPRLLQADGEQLPFRDSVFDAVLLIQIFGGLRGWRRVMTEARRVLRPGGAIIVGRTSMPSDGIDARLKQQLDEILNSLGIQSGRENTREQAEDWLRMNADNHEQVTAARWSAARTPRGFIERHGAGRRFSALPSPVREQAMRELCHWADGEFGSLETSFSEPHAFELQIFKFQHGKD
jgi:ubiquinone/menaquinone biosynthesis C-methylase UbiE